MDVECQENEGEPRNPNDFSIVRHSEDNLWVLLTFLAHRNAFARFGECLNEILTNPAHFYENFPTPHADGSLVQTNLTATRDTILQQAHDEVLTWLRDMFPTIVQHYAEGTTLVEKRHLEENFMLITDPKILEICRGAKIAVAQNHFEMLVADISAKEKSRIQGGGGRSGAANIVQDAIIRFENENRLRGWNVPESWKVEIIGHWNKYRQPEDGFLNYVHSIRIFPFTTSRAICRTITSVWNYFWNGKKVIQDVQARKLPGNGLNLGIYMDSSQIMVAHVTDGVTAQGLAAILKVSSSVRVQGEKVCLIGVEENFDLEDNNTEIHNIVQLLFTYRNLPSGRSSSEICLAFFKAVFEEVNTKFGNYTMLTAVLTTPLLLVSHEKEMLLNILKACEVVQCKIVTSLAATASAQTAFLSLQTEARYVLVVHPLPEEFSMAVVKISQGSVDVVKAVCSKNLLPEGARAAFEIFHESLYTSNRSTGSLNPGRVEKVYRQALDYLYDAVVDHFVDKLLLVTPESGRPAGIIYVLQRIFSNRMELVPICKGPLLGSAILASKLFPENYSLWDANFTNLEVKMGNCCPLKMHTRNIPPQYQVDEWWLPVPSTNLEEIRRTNFTIVLQEVFREDLKKKVAQYEVNYPDACRGPFTPEFPVILSMNRDHLLSLRLVPNGDSGVTLKRREEQLFHLQRSTQDISKNVYPENSNAHHSQTRLRSNLGSMDSHVDNMTSDTDVSKSKFSWEAFDVDGTLAQASLAESAKPKLDLVPKISPEEAWTSLDAEEPKPNLGAKFLPAVQCLLQKKVEHSLAAHKAHMNSFVDSNQLYTSKQIQSHHINIMEALEKAIRDSVKDLSTKFQDVDDDLDASLGGMRKTLETFLPIYYDRYENNLAATVRRITKCTLEAESLYDDKFEELDIDNLTLEEIREIHGKLEKEALTALRANLEREGMDWEEFMLFDLKHKLMRKMEAVECEKEDC